MTRFLARMISTALAISAIAFFSPNRGLAAEDVSSRIKYDQQCFTINGKDTFIYSGAFHYFRCPKELWADRFAKMKEAGLNTVETYVAWNWHEQQPPTNTDDFSKVNLTDLNDWLAMAIDRFGFNVIIRPGPYILAEWDGGGYPQWLITKKPAEFKGTWFRGDDPTYLAWCKHWFTAVAKVAAPWQITHQPAGKPGIILWQIENEYNYDGEHNSTAKLHQLQALAHDSRDLGIDVPLLTCVTEDPLYRKDEFLHANVLDTSNDYPRYDMRGYVNNLTKLATYQPDKLRGITELQGGWFANVGGKLSAEQGFSAAQLTHITLLAWAHGFTSSNYYMMFGGTNFGDWAAQNIITSYDYDAPIREAGGVGPRYLAVSAMGHFLQEHGDRLTRTTEEPIETNSAETPNVTAILRRSADGSRYLFIFNDARTESRKGTLSVSAGSEKGTPIKIAYDLEPFQARIFYLPGGAENSDNGNWFPKPVEGPARPANIPAAIEITSVRQQMDSGPTQWTHLESGQGVESAGIFDRRYVYYRARLPKLSADGATALMITPDLHDSVIAQIDGHPLEAIPAGWGSNAFDLSHFDPSGGELTLLYENPGRPNGGKNMEAPSGIRQLQLVNRADLPTPLSHWRLGLLQDAPAQELAADFDDSQWPEATEESSRGKGEVVAVYRTHLKLTDDQLKSQKMLTIAEGAKAATVYLNGQQVPPVDSRGASWRGDLSGQLRPGDNVLAIVLPVASRHRTPQGVQLSSDSDAAIKPVADLDCQISGDLQGIAGNWSDASFDDSKWQDSTLPVRIVPNSGPPGQPAAELTWYRLHFSLPDKDSHAWVPWEIQLDASGNGLVYLNGHPLGRWWEVGPQRKYYLPECWLNFGPGQSNVVSLCLRPVHAPSELRSAKVSPQTDLAEQRN